MSAKHTQAPWLVHQGDDYISVYRGGQSIDDGIFVDNIDDAKLIAAAPDLLEALKHAESYVELVYMDEGGEEAAEAKHVLELARAAIAAATGERNG
ncbi:MAG: hypothetical protein LBI35_05105 [Burkholderiales bacterium]|jgi:hypothetical protein|nr:hypothetical protein [Burkholderiales bacterium]